MTANTRLDEKRLDLPIEDFIIDLFSLGLTDANVITAANGRLTAQQTWPFAVSAYSTAGTPRPCWFIIRMCDEIDQLISYLEKAKPIGNGYYRRRADTVITCLRSIKNSSEIRFSSSDEKIFKEITPFSVDADKQKTKRQNPFDPTFIKRTPVNSVVAELIHKYLVGELSAGSALASILETDSIGTNERKVALSFLHLCFDFESINGLVTVLRSKDFEGYISVARKKMFFIDFIKNGPKIK